MLIPHGKQSRKSEGTSRGQCAHEAKELHETATQAALTSVYGWVTEMRAERQ